MLRMMKSPAGTLGRLPWARTVDTAAEVGEAGARASRTSRLTSSNRAKRVVDIDNLLVDDDDHHNGLRVARARRTACVALGVGALTPFLRQDRPCPAWPHAPSNRRRPVVWRVV